MQPHETNLFCPRCGTRNVLGHPRCRGCGASLPPPEVLIPRRAAGPRRGRFFGFAALAIAALILAGFLVLHQVAGRTGVTPGTAPFPASLQPARSSSEAAPAEEDPLIAEARRTIRRLQEEHGLAPPPTDEAGRVHLRSGGSISREEWERAARSLQSQP
ncbi:MAG: hypothetical protein ACP5VE_08040 [Chthonomonadales bacterium]